MYKYSFIELFSFESVQHFSLSSSVGLLIYERMRYNTSINMELSMNVPITKDFFT